jgi:hypothetical protein
VAIVCKLATFAVRASPFNRDLRTFLASSGTAGVGTMFHGKRRGLESHGPKAKSRSGVSRETPWLNRR